MTSLAKSYSVQLKRKPNSHTKLPKIEKDPIISQKKLYTNEFEVDQKYPTSGTPNSQMQSLYSKRGNSINLNQGSKTIKTMTQQNEGLGKICSDIASRKLNNKSVIKLKPIGKQDTLHELNLQRDTKQKIVIETTGITDSKTDSAGSSRASLHPVVNQIQGLITDQTKNVILPVKSYNQNSIGQVSSIWWCVIDSLFISLQKIIKVKQIQTSPQKQGKSIQKSKQQKQKVHKQSPNKGQKQKVKKDSSSQNSKKISGIIESNTKASIQISRVYSCLEQQIKKNEETILKYYEDPTHLALILQAFFYEKAVIYLLGTIRKWNHFQQHLYIHSLAAELMPCVVQCRKLIIDILMEAVENQQQDNKIRKPKYIAREKKLIQISKFTTMMKSQYQKYINSLGSPNRYKNFSFPQNLKDHFSLIILQQKWRNLVFDVPVAPFIPDRQNRKQYLIVIEPLNFLYKYNKKQQSLQIDSYAEIFLKNLNIIFDIVLFTHADKDSSLLNFLGILDKAEILAVLDRHYMTYLTAKPVKDISKIGGGYPSSNILVVDDKSNSKYYLENKKSLLLLDNNQNQTKIARVNGKLVRLDDHDEDYLKNLSNKIINCAQKGGHWDEIINDKHERKK